jgi:hypothetical protein
VGADETADALGEYVEFGIANGVAEDRDELTKAGSAGAGETREGG